MSEEVENVNTHQDDYKTRLFNMILDNGMSLTLAVCTVVAIYMIMHQYNQILIETVGEMKEERIEITKQLIDCYKYKNDE